jgi:hypothetical protein
MIVLCIFLIVVSITYPFPRLKVRLRLIRTRLILLYKLVRFIVIGPMVVGLVILLVTLLPSATQLPSVFPHLPKRTFRFIGAFPAREVFCGDFWGAFCGDFVGDFCAVFCGDFRGDFCGVVRTVF